MSALTGIIITPDSTLYTELETVLSKITAFQLIHNGVGRYQDQHAIGAMLRANSPSIVFVDVADMPRAIEIANHAGKSLPGVKLVAIAREYDSKTMLAAMQAGMREFLAAPLCVEDTQNALLRLRGALETDHVNSKGLVYCFVPAKPGVGASTVCLNTATAMSALPGARVALLDFDFYSGTLDFMMNLDAGYSVRDAAEHGEHLDETIWNKLISKRGRLEVLRAGKPDPDRIPSPSRLAALVSYAREHYSAVCIDLPGAADHGSIEALRAAGQILLVTSPEIASIHMAKRTVELLKEHNLSSKVGVVVNRIDARAGVNRSQIAELLGVEVVTTFPNNYQMMQRALCSGQVVSHDAALGKRFTEFANLLLHPRELNDPKLGILGYLNRIFGPKPSHPLA